MSEEEGRITGKILRLPVELRAREGEGPPLKRTRPPKPYCGHRYGDLDVHARSLTCRDCGCEIDPYAFLNQMMHESDYTHAAETKRQLCAEIDALAKERQRLRDAVNRLKRKGAT